MLPVFSRDELKIQAATYDSANITPSLLRRLIAAEMKGPGEIYIRTDQGTRLEGWDGRTVSSTGGVYLPQGEAVWEISAEENVTRKATKDFEKRVNDPGTVDPKQTTYVAVTLRSWEKKDAWVAEKKSQNFWKDVRAYDVDDVSGWLERWPQVTSWLAWKTGKPTHGIISLDQFEQELKNSINSGFPLDLLLVDREIQVGSCLEWFANNDPLKTIKGDSRLEAAMFLMALLRSCLPELQERLRSKSVVIENKDALRAMATPLGSANQMILIANSDEINLSNRDLMGYSKVLQCVDKRHPSTDADTIALPLQKKESLKQKLGSLNYPKHMAAKIVDLSNGHFHTLLRKFGDGNIPSWANDRNGPALTPLILIGGWDVLNEVDIKYLKRLLLGREYAEFEKLCKTLSTQSDSPVTRSKNSWKLVSRLDSWQLIAMYLSDGELKNFAEVTKEVLSLPDPQFDVAPQERWYKSDHPKVSSAMRTGMAETLVLLSLYGDSLEVLREQRMQDFVGAIVRKLLPADWKTWAALDTNLQLLAEAAPAVFLDQLESSIEKENGVKEFLKQRSGGIFGGAGPIADLMWALEVICWEKEHLARAVLCLGGLANSDLEYSGNIINGPLTSLSSILGPFCPQTEATLPERLDILILLTKNYPEVSWRLHDKLLPQYSTISHTATPQFKDYVGVPDKYRRSDLKAFINHSVDIFLSLVEKHSFKQSRLVEIIEKFDQENQKKILERIQIPEDEEERQKIWLELNTLLSIKSQRPSSARAIAGEVEELVKKRISDFLPKGLEQRHRWLFDDYMPDVQTDSPDYKENEKTADSLRSRAIEEILAKNGIQSVVKFASLVKLPHLVGKKLGDVVELKNRETLFLDWIEQPWFPPFYASFAASYFERAGDEVMKEIALELKKANKLKQLSTILLQISSAPATWEFVKAINEELVTSEYWMAIHPYGKATNEFEAKYMIDMLLRYDRPQAAAAALHDFTERGDNKIGISNDGFFKMLSDIINKLVEKTWDGSDTTMTGYYLSHLIMRADALGTRSVEELGLLEWKIHALIEGQVGSNSPLRRWLNTEPSLFCELVTFLYKADDGTVDEKRTPEEREKLASAAFNVLHHWKGFPGHQNGKFAPDSFLDWFRKAKELNATNRHTNSGEYELGKVLSRAPSELEIWPHSCVAEYIEKNSSTEERRHCYIEIFNNRGVVTRNPTEGGAQERELAEQYARYSKHYLNKFPKVARLLKMVSDGYLTDAKREDINIERFN